MAKLRRRAAGARLALADTGQPMRAWDLCEALDLPTLPKNTEGIRAKLKRLASRGILAEPEPGLFVQPRPWQQPRARDQRASPNHNHETDMGAARFE